ncbi:MAG: hypothetical protein AAGD07_05615 [Planctomycetota bacterium]
MNTADPSDPYEAVAASPTIASGESRRFGSRNRHIVAGSGRTVILIAASFGVAFFVVLILAAWLTLGGSLGTDATGPWVGRWVLALGGLWFALILAQTALAWLVMRACHAHPIRLTLTIGGVWTAPIPASHWRDDEQSRGLSERSEGHLDRAVQRPRTGLLVMRPDSGLTLIVWAAILMLLMIVASGCLLFHHRIRGGTLIPSLGSSSADQPLVAMAWLACLQAAWQSLPMPQSLGRAGWVAMIVMFRELLSRWRSNRRSPVQATVTPLSMDSKIALNMTRRCVRLLSIATLVGGFLLLQLTLGSLTWESNSGIDVSPVLGPTWLAIGVASLSMFLSASARDLPALVDACASEEEDAASPSNRSPRPRGWITRFRDRRREKRQTQQLRDASVRERSEAEDAIRADAVLARLHDSGPESLSEDDRQVLQRVSEALRREKERGARE